MKRCPRCGLGLNETEVGDVSVDGCIGCGGVWFDGKELSAVAQAGSGNLKSLEKRFWPGVAGVELSEKALCPSCGIPLAAFEFPHAPGVKLDGCRECKGIWVDEGELASLRERLGHRVEAPAPAREDVRAHARDAIGILAQIECSGCRQMNPAASSNCWACGIRLPGARGVLCPRCDRPLQGAVRFGTRIDHCGFCGGVWLDGGELTVLLAQPIDSLRRLDEELHANAGFRGRDGHGMLVCPVCRATLEQKPFASAGGALLDSCMYCRGVWADAGEFARIAEAAATH